MAAYIILRKFFFRFLLLLLFREPKDYYVENDIVFNQVNELYLKAKQQN